MPLDIPPIRHPKKKKSRLSPEELEARKQAALHQRKILLNSGKPPETAEEPEDDAVVNIDLTKLAESDRSTQIKADLLRVQELLVENMQRKSEALRLWEPMPNQDLFHKSKARTRLVRGGNRSGKTMLGAVEVARACCNADPYQKYPKSGEIYIVSEQWGEIGRVIYPKLFMKGAYKVIRDKETGLIRSYRPWTEEDKKRVSSAKDAAPLIPKRYIQSIAWHEKKLNQPALITLKTGWRIHFFSGDSKPPSGSAIDLAWLDEEIPVAEWFVELNSRIAEREGRIVWTATPEIGTDQFHDFCQKAQDQIHLLPHERDVEEYKLSVKENPHLSDKAKAGMASMLSAADYQVRFEGEFASLGRIIFPEYKKSLHGIDWFEIPRDWTFYAAVDPGHQVCAVLFGVVPDPQDMVEREDPFDLLLFDELYIPKCNARIFAQTMAKKVLGKFDLEEIVIDTHGSRVTEAGSGLSIYDQYAAELADAGVTTRRRKYGFALGSDDVKSAIEQCRHFLGFRRAFEDRPGKPTVPRMRVMCKRDERGQLHTMLPNFDWEITRWKYKVVAGHATEDPETRGRTHLMACARYLTMLNPRYVVPPRAPANEMVSWLEKEQRQFDRQQRDAGMPTQQLSFGPAGQPWQSH